MTSYGKLVAIYRPRAKLTFLIYEHTWGYKAICEENPELQFTYIKFGGKNAIQSFKKKIRQKLRKIENEQSN